MPERSLEFHDKPNDAIRGKRIVVEAREIGKPSRISARTHMHGGMRTIAREAVAWVEIPYRWVEKRYSLK